MWQIGSVRPLRRWEHQYTALLARASLLLISSLLTASVPAFGPSVAVVPALLLLMVAALASLPLPASVPAALSPVAESFGAALIIGSLQGQSDLFLPYLLVPVTVAGFTVGPRAALTTTGTAAAVLSVAAFQTSTGARVGNGPTTMVGLWMPLLAAVGLVAAWARRVTRAGRPAAEPAYADAHRLLSELHVVARQLSLGLDPTTLAAALVEEVDSIVDGSRTTVLVRSPGGRFVPLLGEQPGKLAEAVVLDAWLVADMTKRSDARSTVVALPVLMGERVVAVVVLQGSGPLDDTQVTEARKVLSRAGARLASALLFDDVRQLATVDERMRMAREIHDGIAQDLASVGYLLDDIARDADTEVAARLKALRDQLGDMVGELRLSIFDLRAGVDEKIGLGGALGDYVQRVAPRAGLRVHLSLEESPNRLPRATEVEILRIVQEAVTNVRRHAHAENLWLTVTVSPPTAQVVVSDDGRGLGPNRVDSMGITGMRERASRIGAALQVGPGKGGRGTTVEILLDPNRTACSTP
ncbi:MAG: sensor histidine kinase [Actinomycetota bacterium]|nr:sensor histidine kinase [Actinomycetota bacterium]